MLHCVFQEFTLIVAIPEITGNQVKSYNVRKKERAKKKKERKKTLFTEGGVHKLPVAR